MKKEFGLQMPMMPNYIKVLIPGSTNLEEGFKERPSLDIAQLNEPEAMEYAENMRKHFLAHWAERRRKLTTTNK